MLFKKKKNLNEASLGLKLGAIFGILFLHVPLFLIILYAFTTEDKSYQFPPPGYTLKWFSSKEKSSPLSWSMNPSPSGTIPDPIPL